MGIPEDMAHGTPHRVLAIDCYPQDGGENSKISAEGRVASTNEGIASGRGNPLYNRPN